MYLTLEDHIEWYMNDCVDYILKTSGKPQITLLGVCQGGTFSTISQRSIRKRSKTSFLW